MPQTRIRSTAIFPRIVAYLAGLLLVPPVIGLVYFGFGSSASKAYIWMSILIPGMVLNGTLAWLSIRERTIHRFLPRLLTLLVFTAIGLFGYTIVLILISSGSMKPGG